jgi:hypothetical protein
MIKYIFVFLLWTLPALAQNVTCADRPSGDSSNACANTRFVQSHTTPPGGLDGQIQYNNNGVFGGRATSGNGIIIPTTTGTLIDGHCIQVDSFGNLVDSGDTCNAGAIPFNIRDYGATGDGTTDDAPAIQATIDAIKAAGVGTLIADVGTSGGHVFRIGEQITIGNSNPNTQEANINIGFSCAAGAVFRATTAISTAPLPQWLSGTQLVSAMFQVNNIDGLLLKVQGCIFDMGSSTLSAYSGGGNSPDYGGAWQNAAFAFTAIDNTSSPTVITFERNQFNNLFTYSLLFYNSKAQTFIRDNYFSALTPEQNQSFSHISNITYQGVFSVTGNQFKNSASPAASGNYLTKAARGTNNIVLSWMSNGHTYIEDNVMDYCARSNNNPESPPYGGHRLGCIDFYNNSSNVTVRNNVVTNAMNTFLALRPAWPADVYGNKVTLNSEAYNEPLLTIEGDINSAPGDGARHINIFNNLFVADASPLNLPTAVECNTYSYDNPCRDINIYRNSFLNFLQVFVLSNMGQNIRVEDNYIYGDSRNQIRMILPGAGLGTEANYSVEGISIKNNHIYQPGSGLDIQPVLIDFNKSPAFTGTIGVIDISGNFFYTGGSANGAAFVRGNASPTSGRVKFNNNIIQNFNLGIQLQGLTEFQSGVNTQVNVTTDYSASSVTTVNAGITKTGTVRNAADTGSCTITTVSGLITGGTCFP